MSDSHGQDDNKKVLLDVGIEAIRNEKQTCDPASCWSYAERVSGAGCASGLPCIYW